MQDGSLYRQVVLVVEDEPVIAQSFQEGLEHAGAEVIRAGLKEVPAFIQRRTPSAAILDSDPVSRERRAIVRRLRQLRVPYLFYGTEPRPNVTTERDAPFIAKPCPPEKIVAAVRYLLGRL